MNRHAVYTHGATKESHSRKIFALNNKTNPMMLHLLPFALFARAVLLPNRQNFPSTRDRPSAQPSSNPRPADRKLPPMLVENLHAAARAKNPDIGVRVPPTPSTMFIPTSKTLLPFHLCTQPHATQNTMCGTFGKAERIIIREVPSRLATPALTYLLKLVSVCVIKGFCTRRL